MSGASVDTLPVRRLGRAERRASILERSTTAFAAHGYDATSIAEIARAAGVSHLIIYRHFSSKRELYRAVLERAVSHLDSALQTEGAIGGLGPTPAALLEAARSDPDSFRLLWRHAVREPEFASYPQEARNQLIRSTREALSGSGPSRRLAWAARSTVAFLLEATLIWVEDGEKALDKRWVAATEAALTAGVRSWTDYAGTDQSGGAANQ